MSPPAQKARPPEPRTAAPPPPEKTDDEVEAVYADVFRAIVEDPESTLRPPSVLFQDFQVRCRMGGLAKPPLDLPGFVRRLSCARAGIFDMTDEAWTAALDVASGLPDDMLGAFLLVARAAREGLPCPPDTKIAEIYGGTEISERHRHRYEVNMAYRERLEAKGLRFSGLSPDGLLPETVEHAGHPWFIGVQFHPELKSRPFEPHPLFKSFISAAIVQSRLV